ncbi:hypothetical protein Scep_016233 [Stephania cephalantha]|uniref:Uncharacterized protein n=1 Tax=Stephania cephalantha TaxID=152367 RepID=A0AAP0IN37_9MAGN
MAVQVFCGVVIVPPTYNSDIPQGVSIFLYVDKERASTFLRTSLSPRLFIIS